MVARADAGAVVAVELLVEEHEIAKVRVIAVELWSRSRRLAASIGTTSASRPDGRAVTACAARPRRHPRGEALPYDVPCGSCQPRHHPSSPSCHVLGADRRVPGRDSFGSLVRPVAEMSHPLGQGSPRSIDRSARQHQDRVEVGHAETLLVQCERNLRATCDDGLCATRDECFGDRYEFGGYGGP